MLPRGERLRGGGEPEARWSAGDSSVRVVDGDDDDDDERGRRNEENTKKKEENNNDRERADRR